MTQPTVDILMAAYNGERFVAEQIESIQEQSFHDWRLIVSDDCSSDGTLDIVRRFAHADSRIQIMKRKRKSGSAQANFLDALRSTSASYVMFCDQDDFWLPHKLETFLAHAEDHDGSIPSLYFSDMEVVDDYRQPIHDSFMLSSHLDSRRIRLNQLLPLCCVAGCASMMNRPLVDIVNKTDSYQAINMHDAWVALVACVFGRIYYIDEITVQYRQHFDNVVGSKDYFKAAKKGLRDRGRRETLYKTCLQARAFLEVYGNNLDDDVFGIIRAYSEIPSTPSHLKRIGIIEHYDFWKYGIARKIDQVLNI